MKADLAGRGPVKNVFEETRLDPAHGGSAFWNLLPQVLGIIFGFMLAVIWLRFRFCSAPNFVLIFGRPFFRCLVLFGLHVDYIFDF